MPERHRYGSRRSQVAELWRPDPAVDGGGTNAPVVVLIHGGYWRAIYTKRLMHPLARAIAALGYAVWNLEYRRVGLGGGGGGWPATFSDVAAGVDHLVHLDGIDAARVTTCGHSAGGHLALWLAGRHRLPPGAPGADPVVRPSRAIALAGVADLVEGARMGLGGGAVPAFLGGDPEDERYRPANPAALLPLGIPQTLLHGDADTVVPLALSEGYRDAAMAAGDVITLDVVPGADHRAVIAPKGPSWAALQRALGRPTGAINV